MIRVAVWIPIMFEHVNVRSGRSEKRWSRSRVWMYSVQYGSDYSSCLFLVAVGDQPNIHTALSTPYCCTEHRVQSTVLLVVSRSRLCFCTYVYTGTYEFFARYHCSFIALLIIIDFCWFICLVQYVLRMWFFIV